MSWLVCFVRYTGLRHLVVITRMLLFLCTIVMKSISCHTLRGDCVSVVATPHPAQGRGLDSQMRRLLLLTPKSRRGVFEGQTESKASADDDRRGVGLGRPRCCWREKGWSPVFVGFPSAWGCPIRSVSIERVLAMNACSTSTHHFTGYPACDAVRSKYRTSLMASTPRRPGKTLHTLVARILRSKVEVCGAHDQEASATFRIREIYLPDEHKPLLSSAIACRPWNHYVAERCVQH